MKLLVVFVFAAFSTYAATSYSQEVMFNFNLRSVTVKQVFDQIENNSEFILIYNEKAVDLNRTVSVRARNESVQDILDQVFRKTGNTYNIYDRQIVIKAPEQSSSMPKVRTSGQQQKTISGTVVDEDGMALPGVTVVIPGTTTGTVTDINGKFSLDIPTDAKSLSFSFIGYSTQVVPVGQLTTFNITLKPETTQLGEVVAVGYGVQRKSDMTGATDRLTSENMNKSVATSPVEMMQGRVSGVNITQDSGEPGTGMTVRVRGSNSIRSGQTPLYVVDGVPLDNNNITPAGGSASGYGGGANLNPISFLNPDDIESIDILKDASSTAIYGARGANGVIIITTKKGKQGKGTITYDGYMGVSQIRKKLDLLSASEFRSYTKADGSKLLDMGASNNWQDKIFTTAITQSHNLSYGGGTENFTYRSSFGYLDQKGIVNGTGMTKMNGSIKVSQIAFNGKLKLDGNLTVSHIEDQRAPITSGASGGGYEGDLILTALKLNPTYPVFNQDGTYYQNAVDQRNPVAMLNLVDDQTQTDRILANVAAEYEIIKNFKYKFNLGFDRTNAERRVNQNKQLSYLSNKGEADINNITANNRLVNNYFTYLTKIGDDHSFNFLLGHEYQYVKVTTHNTHVNGFESEGIKYTNSLGYGNFSNADVSSSAIERELQSFFGRVNYNYKQKYLFTFTGRYDGSSKFGKNKKYGFFPSAALAWRLSQEDFLNSSTTISNLKLRLGWGQTGNQEIPDKISLMAVGTSADANGYFNGTLLPGITFQRTPNPDIQWETTEQTDVGLDFGFWDNRLSGTIDYFHKKTTDVLLEIPSKQPAATPTQWQNVPGLKILNNGIELSLNALLVQKKDFTWELGGNFSYVKNEVKDLPVKLIETGVATGQGLSDTRVQIITNGEPVGTFYGMVFQGFDANGISTYKTDVDGNPVKEPLGSALPDFTYSFTSKIQFKGFDLSMLWYGSHGNKVYNNTANALFTKTALDKGYNVTQEVFHSKENPDNSNAYSSRFIEDASFLRWSNLTIGYTFNTKNISWLGSARVYVTGNNLALITNYSGFDPEVNIDANYKGVPSLGIDYTQYPKPRTFTFGVNLTF
jgi:iron complex outermembrane receptor protein